MSEGNGNITPARSRIKISGLHIALLRITYASRCIIAIETKKGLTVFDKLTSGQRES